jgi:bacteriorhodopsin
MDRAHHKLKDVMRLENEIVNTSFYITYAFLMTTATITFIEAIRTKDIKIRNILNLETCISVVAAFFYSNFVHDIKENDYTYEKINTNRYTDWAITTPLMLLVLVLVFLYNTKKGGVNFFSFCIILLLNYGMLGSGYIGELGIIDRTKANTIGFGFFVALFGYIYMKYLSGNYNSDNSILFWIFVVLWSMYGVFYTTTPLLRNIGYNVLDLFSKCFVGIFFWAYFTGVFTLE